MTSPYIRNFILLFFILIFAPAQKAHADTGPKPTMEFNFKQDIAGEPLTITSGVLYECDQPDCSDASPLEELGPQRLTCDEQGCNALAYGFADYHRLEIQFSDGKTRLSNIFKTAGFNSIYRVTIQEDALLVEAQFHPANYTRTGMVIVACICGLLFFAACVAIVIFMIRRTAKR